MANKNDMQEDGIVVEMTDEQGNKYYYEEETIIPVADEKFAILVGIHNDEDNDGHTCTCGCGCEDGDEDVLVAKIVLAENGEEEYVEPTDEEFERFQQAYEALVEESEAEE